MTDRFWMPEDDPYDGDVTARKWAVADGYSVLDDPNNDHIPLPTRHDEAQDEQQIRSGRCPRCYVALEDSHCFVCGQVWRLRPVMADRSWSRQSLAREASTREGDGRPPTAFPSSRANQLDLDKDAA